MNIYKYTTILVGVEVLITLLFLLLKSYFEEKGRIYAQLMHKEELTNIEESIKQGYRKEFDAFTNERHYLTERYMNLYSELYAIVAQSEYVRYFLSTKLGREEVSNTTDIPFVEINKSIKNTNFNLSTGEMKSHTQNINDEITDFNKEYIYKFVILKRQYASQSLLSLALSYRYVHDNYSGTKNIEDKIIAEKFDKEEVKIIRKIVELIICEYNWLRKQLGLSYVENELNTGIFDDNIFDNETIRLTDDEIQIKE